MTMLLETIKRQENHKTKISMVWVVMTILLGTIKNENHKT